METGERRNYSAAAFRRNIEGNERLIILASERESDCDGTSEPYWHITIGSDPRQIPYPQEFPITKDTNGNWAYKNNKGEYINASAGNVKIQRFADGSLNGSVDLIGPNNLADYGKFDAKWCGEWKSKK